MHTDYGRRLMPTILHFEAEHNPHRTFAIAAKSDNIEDGFHEVTFQQVAQAVNHVSHWLQARFESGNKPVHQTTLTYIGPPDLRYNILFYAAVQCRYKVRFSGSLMIPKGVRWILYRVSRSFSHLHEILLPSMCPC
jgi:acyl-CoA synthetase (AMP-forming)/AMP-acid ligase II